MNTERGARFCPSGMGQQRTVSEVSAVAAGQLSAGAQVLSFAHVDQQ